MKRASKTPDTASKGREPLSEPHTNGVAKASNKTSWAESNGIGDRDGFMGLSGAAGHAVALLGTVVLLVGCPAFVFVLWYINCRLDGSVSEFVALAAREGAVGLWQRWPTPTAEAWAIIGTFGAVEAFLQLALPGKKFLGPVSPKGNVPVYKANGMQAYVTTLVLFFAVWGSGIYNPARVYDLMGEILAALNIFSLLFCLFLNIKGHVAPSSTDSGSTGSLLYDYYWGMELYPRIGRSFDIKTWTNCRVGMMGWGILILCYAAKQVEEAGFLSDSMAVSVILMHVYIAKFFWWETGYWKTMDIMHDRAGYYICWGCLVWIPSMYTSPTMFLVKHPMVLGPTLTGAVLAAGLLCIYINYDADRQRQVFRESNGKALIWGRKPKKIEAQYTTADGQTKTSLLLVSGWWGVSRHFHYLPEILASVFWSVPAQTDYAMAYLYSAYLTILLVDRAFRDDLRCASKYGKHWVEYCRQVPHKIVPYIF
uniref:7-dehydrocholesterol reductase n=1 Tax=Tetraselmis sp. GSL018 TaxID=582737 RepID=A0A061S7K6_9CHLO|mmetsp:Transcript_21778/g.52047  ORF Transcript_21778/g.52047 Transcript_21778/m.52047 type:complete len:481 (-) Transcript_21778:219-1661(-)